MKRLRAPYRIVFLLVGLIVLVSMAGAFLLLPVSSHLKAHLLKVILVPAAYVLILYTITRHPGARRLRYLISTFAVLIVAVLCYDFCEDVPAIFLLYLFPIATAIFFWDTTAAIFTAALSTLTHAAVMALTAPLTANLIWDLGLEGISFFLIAILGGIGVQEWRLRTEQLSALNAIAETVSQSLDLDTVLSSALDKVLETLEFESGAIYVRDLETGELEMKQCRGLSEEFRRAVAKGVISARAADSGKPIVIDDLSQDSNAPRVVVEEGYRPLASIPLISKEQVQGVLTIASRQLHRFHQQDVDLLLSIGNQIGVAIEKVRLYQAELSKSRQLAKVLEIGEDLKLHLDLDRLLERIAQAIRESLGFNMVAVNIISEDGKAVVTRAVAGLPAEGKEKLLGAVIPMTELKPLLQERFKISRSYFISHEAEVWDERTDKFTYVPDSEEWKEGQWHPEDALLVPLETREQRLVGFLSVDDPVDGKVPSLETIHSLEIFANQAAIAIENARLFNEAQQRIAELATFNEIGRAIASTMKLDELWELIYHQTCRVMEVSAFYITLYDREKGELNIVLDMLHGQRQPQEEGPHEFRKGRTEYIIRTKKPLLIRGEVQETYDRLGIVSSDKRAKGFAGVPITAGGEVIGVLAVQNYERDDAYDEHTIELLSTIANQAAIAIENARLYEETQKRLAETTVLHKVAEIINATLDLKEVFQRVVEELSNAFGYRLVDIYLLKEEGLRLQAQVGYDAETTIDSIPLERGVVGRVARTGEPALVPDVSQDPDYIPSYPDITSEICVPIKSGETLLGVLNVECAECRFLTEDDLLLLHTLSSHIGVAIKNACLYEEELRRVSQLRLMREVGERIASILDLDQLLNMVVSSIREAFGYHYVAIFLVDARAEEIVLSAQDGPIVRSAETRLKIGKEGITGWVAQTGEPLLVNDVRQEPRYYFVEELKETRSEVAIPIRTAERVIGVLDVESTELDAFDESDLDTLQTLADQLAVAIENARLYEEEQRRSAQRRTIAEVGRRAAAILDMDTLFPQVVDLIAQNFGYYRVHIFQIDPDSVYAIYKAGTGKAGLAIAEEGLRLKVGEQGLVGWVAQHGEPLLVNNVSQEPRYYTHPQLPDTRSELDVPIRIGGKVIGVLDVQSTELDAFDESDLDTLQTLADQLAVAMENARLYQETKRLAITDSLTGLYNLRYFYETLEKEISRCERYNRPLSLIILDIDDFKAYNDLYGHPAGDDLLIELAQLMSKVTRQTDTLARYGGEEFAIILPETEAEGARFLAERL
ncbi:MAG: GAF domain-containing protein, partial [Anaerolineae bacterium]